MWAKIGFPSMVVLLMGNALLCLMRHPENASQTLVSELMEVVTELVEWALDIWEAVEPPSIEQICACRLAKNEP